MSKSSFARLIAPALSVLALLVAGCASGNGENDTIDAIVVSEVSPDVADAADVPIPDAACTEGQAACSDDGYVLRTCKGGAWVETQCMREQGRLCEAGACVAPWLAGSPKWGACPDDTQATPETLAAKATYYDAIAARLHVNPKLGWIMGVTLPRKTIDCPVGATPPCEAPAVPEATATWQDVANWHTGENDGLWNGLYMASQAFRYAVTKSPDAVANLRVLMAAEQTRMAITGVPGVFTRQFIPPNVPGIACPTDKKSYTVDAEKDDNEWVQIRDDGCVWVVDPATSDWKKSDHCGLAQFAGWCWLDNVSQDEYSGHMLGLGAVWKLVDDPDLKAAAASLIEAVGVHMMQNQLAIVDWDGRITEHGKFWVTSLADTPGFLSSEVLGFLRMAVEVSQRDDLRAFLEDCILQRSGPKLCLPDRTMEATPEPYSDFLDEMLFFVGENGCRANYNNFSMVDTYLTDLLWFERDPTVRELAQAAFADDFMRAKDQPRAGRLHRNSWFDFTFAAFKGLGPASDGPAYDEVEDGICSMREFPASKHTPSLDSASKYPEWCVGRLGGSECEKAIPVAERCLGTFLWWGDPFDREKCTEADWDIEPPQDYLLAYWMGRYFGFIGADQ